MHDRTIIVIGGSAGGVEILTQLVSQLPSDLTAAVFVALHFPADAISVLPTILNRCHTLPASHALDGETIQSGRIYVAPPNYHLTIQPQRLRLSRGPRENGHRPSIDVLFRSAAHAYGSQVIGVILSGMLDDGTTGLATIKANGGIALVQDPSEALFEGMPRSAIENVDIDAILPVAKIATQIIAYAQPKTREDDQMSEQSPSSNPEDEAQIVAQSKAKLEQGEQPELPPSMLTCPDCGGVLWEIQNHQMIRYRCHVGHAYSIDSLISEQTNGVEMALWSAVRALEEKAALARRMAERAREHHQFLSVDRYEERATEAKKQAEIVQKVITLQKGNLSHNGDEPT